MSKRNRKTLKEYFRTGHRPTESDFADLIDSAVNVLDDGMYKDPDVGVALAPAEEKEAVVSVFGHTGDSHALWQLALDRQSGDLKIGRSDPGGYVPSVSLRHQSGVTLDGEARVSGQVCASGRRGTFAEGTVSADGRWHDITEELNGCRVLEVTAGCGIREAGRYAMLTAVAVSCCGKRNRIRKVDSHCGLRGCRLRLRWIRCDGAGKLQVKTRFSYGKNTRIAYHISALWDDPFMEKD